MSDFIDDGYEVDGYIAAVDGVHGSLTFRYRPAVGRLVNSIGTLALRDEWPKFWTETAKALARDPKLLREWDQVDQKGQPVPITEVTVAKIPAEKYHKLWSIIAGQRVSDPLTDGTQLAKTDLEADSKN